MRLNLSVLLALSFAYLRLFASCDGADRTFAVELFQDSPLSPLLSGAYFGSQFIRFAFDFQRTSSWVLGENSILAKLTSPDGYHYNSRQSPTLSYRSFGSEVVESLGNIRIKGSIVKDTILFQHPKSLNVALPDMEVEQQSFFVGNPIAAELPEGVSGSLGLGHNDPSNSAFINRLKNAGLEYMAVSIVDGGHSSVVFTADEDIMGSCLKKGENGLVSTAKDGTGWTFNFDLLNFGMTPIKKSGKLRAIADDPDKEVVIQGTALLDPQTPFVVVPQSEAGKLALYFATSLGLTKTDIHLTELPEYWAYAFDCESVSKKTKKLIKEKPTEHAAFISGTMAKRPLMLASPLAIIQMDDQCFTPYAYHNNAEASTGDAAQVWILGRPTFLGQVTFDLDTGDVCQAPFL